MEALAPLIQKLSDMLRKASPQALDLIVPMEQALGGDHQEPLAELRSKVSGFEFDEAMEFLKSFAKKMGLETLGE